MSARIHMTGSHIVDTISEFRQKLLETLYCCLACAVCVRACTHRFWQDYLIICSRDLGIPLNSQRYELVDDVDFGFISLRYSIDISLCHDTEVQ